MNPQTPKRVIVNLKSPTKSEHDKAVEGLFSGIARWYDFLNHLLSLGIDLYWRRQLALAVNPGQGLVLDLAAGTLDVARALKRHYPFITVPALDFCPPMLKLGLGKLNSEQALSILPVGADAKHLPLPPNTVDAITIAFGIRNIVPREEAFSEMLRVLKPGGHVYILEFGSGQERIWGGLYNWYLNKILPRIGQLLAKDKKAYQYLAETIGAFPPAAKFEAEMQEAGFVNTKFRKLTSGIACLHLGQKPYS